MLKLNDRRGYRRFINSRDEALEVLLRNSRLRISELTAGTFKRILELVQVKYLKIAHTPNSRAELDQLEGRIAVELEHLAFNIWMEQIEMRKKAYMLAHAGEAQAIGQTIGSTPQMNLSRSKLDDALRKNMTNGLSPVQSYLLHFGKVRRDIITCLEFSLAYGETVDQALGRIWLKLPKQKELPKKKVLKTVKALEAKKPTFTRFTGGETDAAEIEVAGRYNITGFEWDQETWDKMIEDLASEHVFTDRSPEKYFDITNPFNDLPIKDKIGEVDKVYAWEVENEVVNDFVEEVRAGQVDAAKQNGIDDFVWIAILDDRTDECCEWRSGLLTSEIAERLKSDKADDHCQAIVPPAHFNCRCTLAPASSDLEAVDNTDTNREFDEWLNQ